MGDRANIFLVDQIDNDNAVGIYAYTHWEGEEWPDRLREALDAGKGRWGDDQYLNRIIVRELFKKNTGDTGGGLSTRIGDNQHPITVVNHDDQTVHFAREGDEQKPSLWSSGISFADYVTMPRGYPSEVR